MLFNFVLTLFRLLKLYSYLLKHRNYIIKKHVSREVLSLLRKKSFLKKHFICKEKSGNVTKVKLVTKIKKHNQIYSVTVLASYCYSEDNA